MALQNRISLRLGLSWLTLNLVLIIQCLSWNNTFILFNFTYPRGYAYPRLNTTVLDDRESNVRFLATVTDFPLQPSVPVCSGANTAPYLMVTGGYFPHGKWLGKWNWPLTHFHLVPRLGMGEAIPPPPICFHDVYRDFNLGPISFLAILSNACILCFPNTGSSSFTVVFHSY
jgi:hypothetical protein